MKTVRVIFDITDKDGNDVFTDLGLPHMVCLRASEVSSWGKTVRSLITKQSPAQLDELTKTLEAIASGVYLTKAIQNHRLIYRGGLSGVNTAIITEDEYVLDQLAMTANTARDLHRHGVRNPKVTV